MLTWTQQYHAAPEIARVRLGPLVVNKCLYKAVLFALAAEVAFLGRSPAEILPDTRHMPANLSMFGDQGHLVGLAAHEKRRLDNASLLLPWSNERILLLANSAQSPAFWEQARGSIARKTNSFRVGNASLPFTFTWPHALFAALESGLDDLRRFFEGQRSAQVDSRIALVRKAVQRKTWRV